MATLIRPPGPTQGMGASDTGEQCKCLACGLAFDAMHTLKEHYRGDLHRCNLKRKVQGLLPLSAADFQSRSEELVAPAVQPAGKEKRSRKLSKEARQRVKQEERARRQQESWRFRWTNCVCAILSRLGWCKRRACIHNY
jgi:hypothetical protein